MKILFTLLINFSFLLCMNAQTPNWSWAKNSSGTADVEPRGVALDPSGNLYVAGRYALGYAVFGNDTLQGYDTVSVNSDVFFVKYNSSGSVQWSRRAGTAAMDRAHAVAVNGLGDIYVAGYFTGDSIVFGANTLYNNNSPMADIFLVKFDGSGNVIWAKREGGAGWDEAWAMAIDALGNVYVTGIFSGSQNLMFGLTSLTNTSTLSGDMDIFVVKYDPAGNVSWAKSAGGSVNEFPESIAVSASGVFLAGNYISPSMTIGTQTLTNTSPGEGELFLAKYDGLGNVSWANSIPGDSVDQGPSVTADASGNVYMSAFYTSDSITFGSFTIHNTSPASSIYKDDIVLVKFDGSGNPLWVRTAAGTDDEQTSSVTMDASGNIYLAGHFKGDSMVIGSTSLFPYGGLSGGYDMCFAKYDGSGMLQWALRAGGDGSDYDAHITSDPLGNVYMAGYFGSSSITFGTSTVTGGGDKETFVAKLSAAPSAVENADNTFRVHIYPNPCSDKVNISLRGAGLNNEITAYNVLGEEIQQITTCERNLVIDLSKQLNGIYFLQVKNEEGERVVKKIILSSR